MRPDCDGTRPAIARSSVDFPAPLGPSTAVMPWFGTRRLTPSNAVTPPYATRNVSTSSIGPPVGRGRDFSPEICVGDGLVMPHLLRRAGSDEAAEVKNVDALTYRHDEIEPVLDESDRHPAAQRSEQLRQLRDLIRREPAGRLVQQQQRGPRHQGAGQ